jgi:hypothetical protein
MFSIILFPFYLRLVRPMVSAPTLILMLLMLICCKRKILLNGWLSLADKLGRTRSYYIGI